MQTILHFAQDSDTSGFFPQLARWHDRSRFKMYFATLNPIDGLLRENLESQGVECFSCGCRRRAEYPLGVMRLAKILRRNQIDILHTHLFEPSVIGLQAGVLARTPVRVMTRHYSDYHTRINKRWHVGLDRLCTRVSHSVIAVSEHTAEHMLAKEGAPPEKLHTVLNGIDFDRVALSGADASERIRREFNAEDTHLLVQVARLHPEKGHHYLFQALNEIQRQVSKPVLLLVAGAGPFEAAYRDEVRRLGCDKMVRFLGFRKDSADLMSAADLVILPSVAEAFGLVLTEALYLGVPVVATRAGGIPEIVDDGVDGTLVPPASTSALVSAIVDLLNDEDRRKKMAGAGRAKVLERFRFEDMVRSYETIYEGLVDNRQRAISSQRSAETFAER
ncbi:MAG TPA: glycosyltransferase [Blastocatellia bacterium]|nr:glycosyltransferase [Blastocatellia bacterium]